MNKQLKMKGGMVVGRGIEWTQYTWNPIGGCLHACQWMMPNGEIANCYAEDVATRVAGSAYPQGFEHHYWHPERLAEPGRIATPAKIFVGSMADVFGHWVPAEQIQAVLDVARACPQHTFQFLTKNPLRLRRFDMPLNCWMGVSTPPDFMWNKPLSSNQKERLLETTLRELRECAIIPRDSDYNTVTTWLSAEPLSWDILPLLKQYPASLRWIVVGAASNGNTYYPPREEHVAPLVEWCALHSIKVFFKGNLKSLPWAASHWHEEFPAEPTPIETQVRLF